MKVLLIVLLLSISSCSLLMTPKRNISRLIEKHEYLPNKDTTIRDTVVIKEINVTRIDTLKSVDSITFISDSISYKIHRTFDTLRTYINCNYDTIFLEKKIKVTDSDRVIKKVKGYNKGLSIGKLIFYIAIFTLIMLLFLVLKN